MKSLLTESDIRYLLEQQERLDADIRKKFSINDTAWIEMDVEHDIALRVEVAEFVNACYKSWKYWKKKTMDRQAILDEAVDVIHFIMLSVNKCGTDIFLENYIKYFKAHFFGNPIEKKEDVRELMNLMLYRPGAFTHCDLLIHLLEILDFYDFDRKQIMQAYKEKNKVNFERLAGGY